MKVRLENQKGRRLWRGSFIAFARANALQAGEMFLLRERLEREGRVLVGDERRGETLRREED